MNICRIYPDARFIAGFVAFLAIGLASANAEEEAVGLNHGDTMPMVDYAMLNIDDQQVTLANITGPKGTVVAFWCNHCPYVKAYEDRFVALAADVIPQGIGVIAVNANDPEAYPEDNLANMKQRAAEKNYSFPYVVDADSALARRFGAEKTPHIFVFDAAGKLVYVGAIDDSTDAAKVEKTYLRDVLQALIDGTAIPLRETRAFGCSIKFSK
jgi:thiol-disulfide isomerase/thioredoxin